MNTKANILNVRFGHLRPAVARSPGPAAMSGAVLGIRPAGIPSQVSEPIIRRVAVVVAALHAVRARADESLKHELMAELVDHAAIAINAVGEMPTLAGPRFQASPPVFRQGCRRSSPAPDRAVVPDAVTGETIDILEADIGDVRIMRSHGGPCLTQGSLWRVGPGGW